MRSIDKNAVIKKYNSLEKIWDPEDKWHIITYRMIKKFIWNSLKIIRFSNNFIILNAGSSGNNYDIQEDYNIFHIDIASRNLNSCKNSMIGNIENIPLRNNSFDLILCVGSVLNYCDPLLVMNEFSRITKSNGFLIIEFENSRTFELVGTHDFNKGVTFVETFYNGEKENIWYFSENFILSLAELFSYNVIKKQRCHILSPLFYRFIKNETAASKFASLDRFCLSIPILRNFSSNSIFLLQKTI